MVRESAEEEIESNVKISRLFASLHAPPASRVLQSASAGPSGTEDDGQRSQGVGEPLHFEPPKLAGPRGAEGVGQQPQGVEVSETIVVHIHDILGKELSEVVRGSEEKSKV